MSRSVADPGTGGAPHSPKVGGAPCPLPGHGGERSLKSLIVGPSLVREWKKNFHFQGSSSGPCWRIPHADPQYKLALRDRRSQRPLTNPESVAGRDQLIF